MRPKPSERRSTGRDFVLRLILALALTLAAVGALQHTLLSRQIEKSYIDAGAAAHRVDARQVEEALEGHSSEAGAAEAPLDEAREVVAGIARRAGVTGVYLVDARGIVEAAEDPEKVGEYEPDNKEPVGSEEAYAGPEREADESAGSFEYVAPIEAPQGRFVLKVNDDGRVLATELSDTRRNLALLIVLGFLVAVPIFFLLGGRRLIKLHNAALSLSTRDGLTGLGNQTEFQEELRRAVALAVRHRQPVAVTLIDVDDFKLANDRLGHRHGDHLLRGLAGVLKRARAEDRAYRIGGDEFALIQPATGWVGAHILANRVREEVARVAPGITLSCGIAAVDEETREADTLQEQADAALYEAKRRGRDTVVAFIEVEDAEIVTPAKVRAVHELLVSGLPDVAFQPIWELTDSGRRILGYEALARPATVHGLSGPGEAFEVAERIGRAHDLDALCRAAVLQRASELPPNTLLFLNVSPQALDHSGTRGDSLVRAVEAAGLRPQDVVLEVTERSQARLDRVVREATRLRELGFKLALDDVGAGNAGLEMLRSLRVDYVKIDREVVAGAAAEGSARAVLHAVIAFANEMGAFVIAEGIETDTMLDLVRQPPRSHSTRRAGVHGAQGYLLGRPSTASLGEPHAAVPESLALGP